MKVKPKKSRSDGARVEVWIECKWSYRTPFIVIAVMEMLILPLFETLDMQLEEHSEDGVTDIHKESCDEKDEAIPEEPWCH